MHKKPHLPTKICAACARPFAWRKKGARDWEAVRYCSERCRRTKGGAADGEAAATGSEPAGAGGAR